MNSHLLLRFPAVHQNEFLKPFASVNFPGIEIAARIRNQLVKPMKLPGIAAVVPRLALNGPVVSPNGPNDIVFTVGYQQKLLALVGRKRELPYRTDPQRFRAQSELLNELPLLGEHLDAVVDAIADIDKPISRNVDAVYRIAKLLIAWCSGIIRPGVDIIRRVSIGSPKSLERAGAGVENNHSLVHIAIGDVHLVCFRIHLDAGWAPQYVRAQTVRRIG